MKRIHVLTLIMLSLALAWAVRLGQPSAHWDARKNHSPTPDELWEAQNPKDTAANPVNTAAAGSSIVREGGMDSASRPPNGSEFLGAYEPDTVVTAEMLDAENKTSKRAPEPYPGADEIVSAEMIDAEAAATFTNAQATSAAVPDEVVSAEMLATESRVDKNAAPSISSNSAANGEP